MSGVREAVRGMEEALAGVRRDYVGWILKNPSRASDTESSVKLLSYFLQARSSSTLLPELIYATSNLLALWHDSLLRHQTQEVGDRDRQIGRVKATLTILEYVEVFLEMSAKHLWGHFGRWLIIILVQAIKTGLRAALLFHYKVGMIESRTQQVQQRSRVRASKQGSSPNVIFVLKHSGRVVRKIHAAPPMGARDWSMPSTPDVPSVPQDLPQIRMIAEAIHLLRPLTHLMSLGIFGTKSWAPWLVSAGMDVASLQIHGRSSRLRKEEKRELTVRIYALCYYLLRSPFYDTYTKRRLLTALTFLADRVPIVGGLCGVLAQAIPEWQSTYSYMW